VPYNAQYFGHKVHVDLNEKLVDFGCILVGAIDGYSGMLLSYFTIHRKNAVSVCQMYRELCAQYEIWDQVRVDHGNEFMLMLYMQFKLQDLKYNLDRKPFVQTTSRMNRVVERTWHEINQRVNYLIKENLFFYVLNDMLDTEND
jgi:hypothetical protein